jgi:hypothetical protein
MPRAGGEARVYRVVDVLREIAVGAYSYWRLNDAEACAARLRDGGDLQEDDVQLFVDLLDAQPDPDQAAEIKKR